MRLVILLMPLLASACANLGAASGSRGREGGAQPSIGELMPDLVMRTLPGNRRLHLGSLKGKVVLVDVWASWCEPCKHEMPLLDDMAARLQTHGIEIVAISVDEDREAAESFLRSRRKWRLTAGHDAEGMVADQLQPPAMPTSYVVDRRGILRAVNAGFEGEAFVRKLEATLLRLARQP
jgi:thiol-disulfide isomerase/thioredoxin